MTMFNEAQSYASRGNAVKKLDSILTRMGKTRDDVRWFVVVTSEHRFVPVVQVGQDTHLIHLAHHGVGVV